MRKKVTASIIPTMVALAALAAFLPSSGPRIKLRQVDSRFVPAALIVEVGDSILVENTGDRTHTFTCPSCGIDTGDVQPGLSKVVVVRRPGTFEFFCRYHQAQGMAGRLVARGGTPAPAASPAASPAATPASSPSP